MATREQTLEYLRFFAEFDTPEGDEASRTVSRLRDVRDGESFARLVPPDSAERRLIVRHLAAFKAAAELIASGRMDSGMFFDGWYDTGNACRIVAPWIEVMRSESGNAMLYAEVEALGPAYAAFRENPGARTGTPLMGPPTSLDREIFAAFNGLWNGERDTEAWQFFDSLIERNYDAAGFFEAVPPASTEWTRFDRILCAYDQAGGLMRRGLLHPALFFAAWRSPSGFWDRVGPWVFAHRQRTKNPHGYDQIDWLVDFERARTR